MIAELPENYDKTTLVISKFFDMKTKMIGMITRTCNT
jgi:hypothetical protein